MLLQSGGWQRHQSASAWWSRWPELTNWPSGTHKRTKLEHCCPEAQADRAFRLIRKSAGAYSEWRQTGDFRGPADCIL